MYMFVMLPYTVLEMFISIFLLLNNTPYTHSKTQKHKIPNIQVLPYFHIMPPASADISPPLSVGHYSRMTGMQVMPGETLLKT